MPPSAVVERLRAAGCVYAEDEARALESTATSPTELEAMVLARLSGTPLEVVVGWAEFDGLRIRTAPGVFVPRRRTELLAQEAARLAVAAGPGAVVLDLCCGSGAVAASVQAQAPEARVLAADLDPAAVACACQNLPAEHVFAGDLYDALPHDLLGRIDVLACNAPYVPSEAVGLMPPEARLHEPGLALDGGTDGLDIQRRVVADAARWLSPEGHLLIETGRIQSATTRDLMVAAGLSARIIVDNRREATVALGSR